MTKIKGLAVLSLLIALVVASRWNATAQELKDRSLPDRPLTTN